MKVTNYSVFDVVVRYMMGFRNGFGFEIPAGESREINGLYIGEDSDGKAQYVRSDQDLIIGPHHEHDVAPGKPVRIELDVPELFLEIRCISPEREAEN